MVIAFMYQWCNSGDATAVMQQRWCSSGDAAAVMRQRWCNSGDATAVMRQRWCDSGDATAVMRQRWCDSGDATAVMQQRWCNSGDAAVWDWSHPESWRGVYKLAFLPYLDSFGTLECICTNRSKLWLAQGKKWKNLMELRTQKPYLDILYHEI